MVCCFVCNFVGTLNLSEVNSGMCYSINIMELLVFLLNYFHCNHMPLESFVMFFSYIESGRGLGTIEQDYSVLVPISLWC